MDDKIKEVIDQYELSIKNVYRMRGAYMLETDQGLRILREFRSTPGKAELAQKIKENLLQKGYLLTDLYEKNKAEEWITENYMGNRYVLKQWFVGEECDLKKEAHIKIAMKNLGRLHLLMRGCCEESVIYQADTFQETLVKHNRELRRVRSYVREKKQRNEFELLFLTIFSEFYQEAEDAESMLAKVDVARVYEKVNEEQTFCHGSYNYHNLMITKAGTATTNFERAHLQVQIVDLYDFLRKLMEKNNWNYHLFQIAVDAYQEEKPLTSEEKTILHIWLAYPEKFWKVTNFYFNSKKSWISVKNIEKLQILQQQKKQRQNLLDRIPYVF